MEFKKIINIGIIISVVVFSGVIAYKYTQTESSIKINKKNATYTSSIANKKSNVPILNNDNCDHQFLNGVRPIIENASLKESTKELCFKGFAVLHSGIIRSPIYAVENLTSERVAGSKEIKREDAFHEEGRLLENERGSLKDYARSGYDRGHLAPSDDMSDMSMQEESFSLANMVMQSPKNNRVLHFGIEKEVRKLAQSNGNIFVATGIAFTEDNIEKKGNVMIPHYIWKAVYVPTTKQASAYWEKNDDSLKYEIISMQELKNRTGIDVFPNVSKKEKETLVNLPAPKIRNKK